MGDWENELHVYLSNVSQHTRNSLYRIKDLFRDSDMEFDRKFRKYFLDAAKNRIKEACDRFEMRQLAKSSQKNRDSSEDGEVPRKLRRKSLSTSSSNAASNEARNQAELASQNRFANDITICGVPLLRNEDLREMVLRFCKNLGIQVPQSDILSVYRNKRSLIVVQFATRRIRDDVFEQSHTKSIFSDDIIRLEPRARPSRIYVTYHVTDHYESMLTMARQSFKDKLIHHYAITERGMGIKSGQNVPYKYFLSANELEDYIVILSPSIWLRRGSQAR